MPYVQPLPWTEYLTCPICTHNFGFYRRHPISLGCGHSVCRLCLASLYNQQCPFDQSPITVDHKNLPVNSALLRLAALRNGENCDLSEILSLIPPPCVREFTADNLRCFYVAKACIEHLAMHFHIAIGNAENPLSRSMQRKLVTLINCQLMTEEGRLRALRLSRCIGERAVIEMIMRQQKPMQLNSCLWAAVRGRGCQFLGPVLQEDVLRHLLAALAGGVALSRKSLVMQVVQSLKSEYSQASKTSVGHVVQLLYRASCFNVSKRECESSLMRLKEEFSTYDSLRQEHDAQIVQIAMEAGLRIPPEQWSTLLYGDLMHKSYMQSIIDRLQTPESFKQSIQELVLTLQRNGDMYEFEKMRPNLQDLANIEICMEKPLPTNWPELGRALHAIKNVVDGFVDFELRVRKQAEERRLSQRSCNVNSSFVHAKTDMDSYRNENFRNMAEAEPQSVRLSRPMMRPGMTTPALGGQPTLQHSNLSTLRHGPVVFIPMSSVQQRFEAPQQTQTATTSATGYKLLHRPIQLQAQKNSPIHPIPSISNGLKTNLTANGSIPPPPGFESLRLSPQGAGNITGSSCSSSIYSSSNSSTDSQNTSCSTNQLQGGGHVTILQPPWVQRRHYEQQYPAQCQFSKKMDSPNLFRQQKCAEQQYTLQLQLQQQQQQHRQQNQYHHPMQSIPNASGSTSLYHTGYDLFDDEVREQRHIQELQQRFNHALLTSVRKVNESANNSGTDSGVNSPPSPGKLSSSTVHEQVTAASGKQPDLEQTPQTQQSLPLSADNSCNGISSNNSNNTSLSSAQFSNSDRKGTENICSPKQSSDSQSEFQSSEQFFNFDRNFDWEKRREILKNSSKDTRDFKTEMSKFSQPIELQVPNISTKKLREIWQVPPEQPQAKSLEEIWQPLQLEQQPKFEQKADQLSIFKNFDEIRLRQQQQQQQQQQQRQREQSHLGLQSDAFSPMNANSNGCTYEEWLTRRNYACMEAAYLKIAERYPNMGLGPWTETSNYASSNNGQINLNTSGGVACAVNTNQSSNASSNANIFGCPPPYKIGHDNMRVYHQRAPEPSNLGLSALRIIGSLGDQCHNELNFQESPAPAQPPVARKTALDAAIETYWKDAMEASLGLNMFLPPASTSELPYPVCKDLGAEQATHHVWDWRDEFREQPAETITAQPSQQPPQ